MTWNLVHIVAAKRGTKFRKQILNWFEIIFLDIWRCVDHSFSAQMNKCFVVKDGVDVQVLGTKHNVVSIGANNAIDFVIHFQFDKLPLSLKRSTLMAFFTFK